MRYALALALILGCSPTAPTDDGADAALDVAPDVVAADAGTPDAGPDAGRPCVDRVRGIGILCADGTCDYTSCGACGNVCPRGYSCCQGLPGRSDYCCPRQ